MSKLNKFAERFVNILERITKSILKTRHGLTKIEIRQLITKDNGLIKAKKKL